MTPAASWQLRSAGMLPPPPLVPPAMACSPQVASLARHLPRAQMMMIAAMMTTPAVVTTMAAALVPPRMEYGSRAPGRHSVAVMQRASRMALCRLRLLAVQPRRSGARVQLSRKPPRSRQRSDRWIFSRSTLAIA